MNSNEVNSLTILNAQCRVMDMILDAIKASRKDLSSTCKAAEEADQLIKEQGTRSMPGVRLPNLSAGFNRRLS